MRGIGTKVRLLQNEHQLETVTRLVNQTLGLLQICPDAMVSENTTINNHIGHSALVKGRMLKDTDLLGTQEENKKITRRMPKTSIELEWFDNRWYYREPRSTNAPKIGIEFEWFNDIIYVPYTSEIMICMIDK